MINSYNLFAIHLLFHSVTTLGAAEPSIWDVGYKPKKDGQEYYDTKPLVEAKCEDRIGKIGQTEKYKFT